MIRPVLAAMATGLALLAHTGLADAEGRIGVAVVGDAKHQVQLTTTLEAWLTAHNREVVTAPLETDSINTIVDCFVIEDRGCARAIIDKRAKAENIVFAKVETVGKRVTISAYWFVKGHDPAFERRVCERCGTENLKTTADGLMKALTVATEAQKPIVEAPPPEPSPPASPMPVVEPPPTPLPLPLPPPPRLIHDAPQPDPTLPIVVGAVAGAALLTSVVLLVHDDDGTAPTYRDTRPAGIVVGIAALGLIGFDIYLWMRGGHAESGPIVGATGGSAVVGWTGRF